MNVRFHAYWRGEGTGLTGELSGAAPPSSAGASSVSRLQTWKSGSRGPRSLAAPRPLTRCWPPLSLQDPCFPGWVSAPQTGGGTGEHTLNMPVFCCLFYCHFYYTGQHRSTGNWKENEPGHVAKHTGVLFMKPERNSFSKLFVLTGIFRFMKVSVKLYRF